VDYADVNALQKIEEGREGKARGIYLWSFESIASLTLLEI
jgi:hypothetical protein